MKLYKKLFDVEEINESKVFIDVDEAEAYKKQFEKSYKFYEESFERNTDIVADITIIENGVKKILKYISSKDYYKNYKNDDDFAIITCFYEQLYFPTNNIWENIW